MQSIRNRGEGRAERRQRSAPRRHGLFSTTALIPAIAALAGGAMMMIPGQALAQTVAASGAVTNGFGDASLCLDPSLDLCPIDLGANDATTPVTVTSFATANAGRSLLLGGENNAPLVTITADGASSSFRQVPRSTSAVPTPLRSAGPSAALAA